MAKPSPSYAKHPVLLAIGESIRRARGEINMSQESLALAADMDRSYLGGIERGEHNLTVMNLIKIADALGIQSSVLLQRGGQ